MSSKKRKYREKISATTGGTLDLFDHPAFRSSLPPQDVVHPGDGGADDRDASAIGIDEEDLEDAPAAEPRRA